MTMTGKTEKEEIEQITKEILFWAKYLTRAGYGKIKFTQAETDRRSSKND